MTVGDGILLGIVQGITEFLPVSSSGHLVLGCGFLGLGCGSLNFDVVVHLGSLAAVLLVYRRWFGRLVVSAFKGRIRLHRGKVRFANPDTRLLLLLLLATVPAALAGAAFGGAVEAAFGSRRLVGAMLLVTGSVLFATRYVAAENRPLNWWRALAIGFAQALALLPGISRSGSTISGGIFTGIKRETAADFSFLLSAPVILGAGLIKLHDYSPSDPGEAGIPVLLAGALAAGISGYVAIRFLLRVIRRGRLHWFAWYCWGMGLLVIVLPG